MLLHNIPYLMGWPYIIRVLKTIKGILDEFRKLYRITKDILETSEIFWKIHEDSQKSSGKSRIFDTQSFIETVRL